jgi:hypothetical protein
VGHVGFFDILTWVISQFIFLDFFPIPRGNRAAAQKTGASASCILFSILFIITCAAITAAAGAAQAIITDIAVHLVITARADITFTPHTDIIGCAVFLTHVAVLIRTITVQVACITVRSTVLLMINV